MSILHFFSSCFCERLHVHTSGIYYKWHITTFLNSNLILDPWPEYILNSYIAKWTYFIQWISKPQLLSRTFSSKLYLIKIHVWPDVHWSIDNLFCIFRIYPGISSSRFAQVRANRLLKFLGKVRSIHHHNCFYKVFINESIWQSFSHIEFLKLFWS